MTLDDAADYLDVIILRRAKLEQLVLRLRAVHLKMTRRRKFSPLIKPRDSHAEHPYEVPFEKRPWEATPQRSRRKGEETHKTYWRKAKQPW